MSGQKDRLMVKGAMLLALLLIFQSLRFIIPLPPIVSMFLIGTLVNSVLTLAGLTLDIKSIVLICIIAPCIAFFQGQLPIIIFIPVIALGNIFFAMTIKYMTPLSKIMAAVFSSLIKMFSLYMMTWIVLRNFLLPDFAAKAMTFIVSWPQLVTATLGAVLGIFIYKRVHEK